MRKHLVRPSTELRLLSHGLVLDLNKDDEIEGFRSDSNSILIGVDTTIPNRVSKGGSFKELVENYCSIMLNFNEHDIFWRGVHKHAFDGKVEYTLSDKINQWDNTVVGFIYQVKTDIYRKHKANHINAYISDLVVAEFLDELQQLSRYENGDIYQVLVSGDDDNDYLALYAVDGTPERIDKAVNDLISQQVSAIDNISKKAKITLKYTPSKMTELAPYMAILTSEINKRHGFSLMMGEAIFDTSDTNGNTITFNVACHSIPDIKDIVSSSKNKGVGFIQRLKQRADRMREYGGHQELTEAFIDEHISHNGMQYIERPDSLIIAVLSAIFSALSGVYTVKNIEIIA